MFIVFTLEPFYGVPAVAFMAMGFIVILYERREARNSSSMANTDTQLAFADTQHLNGTFGEAKPQSKPQVVSKKPSYREILEMTLQNDKALHELERFLLKEFSIENLLFIQAIAALAQGDKTDEEKIFLGKMIFDKFVVVGAALEVNLSSPCRSTFAAIFSEDGKLTSVNVSEMMIPIEQGKQEIMHLLEQDTLRRFLRTEEFKSLQVMFDDRGV